MAAKAYKNHKRGTGRHVQLPEWLQASEAWATLKPGPRALYVELKRRFNGSNNGRIILSQREAAKALNVNRNTVGAWFQELEDRGFIRMMQGPHLGPSGIGKAPMWALDELVTADMKPSPKAFMSWQQKQNPRPKNRPPRPSEWDSDRLPTTDSGAGVPKNGTRTLKTQNSASQLTGHI